MHTRIHGWKARRSGAHITVVGRIEGQEEETKIGVDLIEPRDGRVIATRFKPMVVGANAGREVDAEYQLVTTG